jgi:metallo-beta-lactamase family protein
MQPEMRLDFLGAAGTVTGSRFLVTCGKNRILIDCGLFQGRREIKALNWERFPIDPTTIDAVIFTHAHIDHIGYLPRLSMQGFEGPVYCTPATAAIAAISLPDSAKLQEEDARFINKKGYSRHKPALPLYRTHDARAALKLLKRKPYGVWHELAKGLVFRFHYAGHILGSALVQLALPTGETILFSGDLGRRDTPILRDPDTIEYADYLLIESTYGDRLHTAKADVPPQLADIISRTAERGGVLLIPAFAIGRAQEVLYLLHELRVQGLIPPLPVFLDSPMSIDATKVHVDHAEEHDLEMALLMSEENPLAPPYVKFVRSRAESKRLNQMTQPAIIMSSSGMCAGGRIVHHLANRLESPANTVLFVGYQAEGTLGRRLVDGDHLVRVLGQDTPVRAEIAQIDALSAHADYSEILDWLSHFKRAPKMTFIVHGEPPAAAALQTRIRERNGWLSCIPYYGDKHVLA